MIHADFVVKKEKLVNQVNSLINATVQQRFWTVNKHNAMFEYRDWSQVCVATCSKTKCIEGVFIVVIVVVIVIIVIIVIVVIVVVIVIIVIVVIVVIIFIIVIIVIVRQTTL
jgi:hypothetical protein